MLSIFCKKYVFLCVSNIKFNLLINPYSATCVEISPFEGSSILEKKGREEGKLYAHMQKGYSVYVYKT